MSDGCINARISQPLSLRLRPDFRISSLRLSGQDYRVLHDPVTGKHFQLREEEFYLLQELQRGRHLRAICDDFAARFPDRKLSMATLETFLFHSYRAGILISDYAHQGKSLWEQRRTHLQQRWWAGLLSILQWRILRFNPQHLLQTVGPTLKHLFSLSAFLIWCFGMIATLWIMLTHRYEIIAELPWLSRSLRTENYLLLMVALLLVKSWHELGHAVACYRYGVRCREVGVQLLFGVPCFYCDATESWQLENKWPRMAIAAGGMYFEGFLAASCAIVFHYTLPSMVHQLCLYLVFVSTLWTLFINANPLLRLDGYYLLSDACEIANLETRALAHLRAWFSGLVWGTGFRLNHAFETKLDWRMTLFGFAMVCYRIALLLGMVWALRHYLIPAGLAPVADILTTAILLSAVIPWCITFWRERDRTPSNAREFLPHRLIVVITLILIFIFFVPLPNSISAPAVLQPTVQHSVYATVSGRLLDITTEGTKVEQNERLATLSNQELDREKALLEALIAEQESLTKQLKTGLIINRESSGAQLEAAKHNLKTLLLRRQRLDDLLAGLKIVAPCHGTIHAAPKKKEHKSVRELADWSGQLTNPINRGAYVEEGTLLCTIANDHSMSALTIVDQSEAEKIVPGNLVTLQLTAVAPFISGKVLSVSRTEAEAIPEVLRKSKYPNRSPAIVYFVRIQLNEKPGNALSGMKVRASIQAPWETAITKIMQVWQRYWRIWPNSPEVADAH